MKIRPLQGEALLYMEGVATESVGGIALIESDPETMNPENVAFGEVRAIGTWELDNSGRMKPHPVRLGDRVLINSGSGRWLRSREERLKLIRTDAILAIHQKD